MLKELHLVESIHHFRCINIKDTWRTQRSIPMNTIQEFLFLIIDKLCFLYVTFCSVDPTGSGKNTTTVLTGDAYSSLDTVLQQSYTLTY